MEGKYSEGSGRTLFTAFAFLRPKIFVSPQPNPTQNMIKMGTIPDDAETALVTSLDSLTVEDLTNTAHCSPQLPPHLSHDPDNNLKRSDPFQFGSRFLREEDNVFEFNAWDHVETDDTYKEYAELQYAKQREAPVSDFDKSKLSSPSLFIK